MQTDEKLDLSSIAAPYCFLMCKSTLASMVPGTVLEICVQDPETVEDLLTILTRSGERVVGKAESEGITRLWVQKGMAERPSCPMVPGEVKSG